MQKRALFYCHDGTGVGHLRRISQAADALQGPYACLVVTGLPEVGNFVSPQCEWLRIPSWHRMGEARASRNCTTSWLNADDAGYMALRQSVLEGVFFGFRPDIVFVDYLPLGHRNELAPILSRVQCRKVLLLRGLVDSSDRHLFSGGASETINNIYDEIIVAADKQVVDIRNDLNWPAYLHAKLDYVGYVVGEHKRPRLEVRRACGVAENKVWIVCSAGSGQHAENLVLKYRQLAGCRCDIQVDVVCGFRSQHVAQELNNGIDHCRMIQSTLELPTWHGAADIVVTTGGYNSLLEAATGGARVVVWPIQKEPNDEQKEQARRMSQFYPVKVVDGIDDLKLAIMQYTEECINHPRPTLPLRCNGATTLARRFAHSP